MELFLDVRPIGKGGKGRTACGSSAYRSCDKIVDNDGCLHNYKNKHGYVAGGVILPEGAPEELRNRQTLWQRHDQKEIRKDAQIFREVEVALHNSLNYEASSRVISSIGEKLAEMGMCVQWDIHDTTKRGQRNLHAHLMLSMRELLPDGTFGNKNRSWNMFNGGLNLADVLRPFAAALMNEELQRMGISDRVEHESFADRGIDKVPTVHEGVTARAMARKGKLTYKVLLNQRIKEINEAHLAYSEKLIKYREARAELTELALRKAQDSLASLDSLIEGANTLRRSTSSLDALQEPLRPIEEEIYQSIKVINMQAAGLKKEAEKYKKILQALFTVKNLAGELDLDPEQKDQLEWAVNYLKWAKIEDLSKTGVDQAIEKYRELNTSCRVEQIRLQEAKNAAYDNLSVLRDEKKSWRKPNKER